MSTENNAVQNSTTSVTGVVLMTYGSATTAEHVPEYFERIYKGRASEATIKDFEHRYRLVGRSPLIDITESQAAHLQEVLGSEYLVRAGMRHSAPFIDDAVAECKAAGATSLIGIILSPQFSSFIMEGYKTAFMEAAARHGFNAEESNTIVAGPWGTEPHFIELLAKRTQESLATLDAQFGAPTPVIFTTHSLPQRVIANDSHYLEQLAETIAAVRTKLDAMNAADPLQASAASRAWYAGYQSAGHTPEEWLKPDLHDILKDLHAQHVPAALIVPIQFLADHLEILYDLDIAARAQCEELGIAYNRIELPNTDPLFIEALASIVKSSRSVHLNPTNSTV